MDWKTGAAGGNICIYIHTHTQSEKKKEKQAGGKKEAAPRPCATIKDPTFILSAYGKEKTKRIELKKYLKREFSDGLAG